MRILTPLLLLTLMSIIPLAGGSETGSIADPTCLFPDSVRHSIPPVEHKPIVVEVRTYLVDIPQIDDVNQSFLADIFFRFAWKDTRLAHGQANPCTVELSRIWYPGMLVLNRREVKPQLEEIAEIQPDGTVFYRQRFYGSFSAPIDLTEFPFDTQSLSVNLIAPFSTSEVILVPDHTLFNRAEHISAPNWKIGDPVASRTDYQIRPGSLLPQLQVVFTAKRHATYYLWKIIIPMCMVVCMSWAVFWISPRHIAPRIGLAATSMLTLIAFRLALGASLPPISYLTQLDLFIVGATLLVFMALLQTVASTSLWDSERQTSSLRFNHVSRVLFPAAFLAVAVFSFTY